MEVLSAVFGASLGMLSGGFGGWSFGLVGVLCCTLDNELEDDGSFVFSMFWVVRFTTTCELSWDLVVVDFLLLQIFQSMYSMIMAMMMPARDQVPHVVCVVSVRVSR